MGKFSLEQKIKDRLEGHEVHVDKNELWKGLGIEEEEKDRKAIWLWWMGGFVGIALIASIWWYSEKGTDVAPKIQNSSLITVDESISKTGNETIKEAKTSERLAEIIQNVNAENNLSNNTDDSSQNEIGSIPSSNSKSTNSITVPSSSSNQKSLNIDNNENASSKTSIANNEIPSSLEDVSDITTKVDLGISLISIETLSQSILPLNYERELEKLDRKVNPFIEPVSQPKKFEFGLFAGVGTIQRDITTINDNGELDTYLSVRDSSESVMEHVSAGFDIKYNIGKGFYSKLGLTLNRWNEKMIYSEFSDTTRFIAEIPDVILIDLAGNESVTYTQGEAISYNWLTWTRYNRLTQIDLPITFGYEQNIKRWSIFGEVTAILNLKQNFSGYMYSRELEIVENPSFFKSNVGVNLGLNIGLGYAITDRVTGRLSTRYYRSLNTVLIPETEMAQRYTSLGLRASVGYLF